MTERHQAAAERESAIAYPGAARAARGMRTLSHIARESERLDPEGRRIAETTISNIESGARQPSAELLERLAAAEGVDPESIGHVLADDEVRCSHCRGRGIKPAPAVAAIEPAAA